MLRGLAALVFLYIFLPVIFVAWISLFRQQIVSFPPEGYTLDWYKAAWEIPRFRAGFLTSLQLAVVATGISLLVGVPASVVLARGRFPGREAIQSLLMAPLIVPGIVAGAAFYMFLIEIEVNTGVQVAMTFTGLAIAHSLIALPWTVRLVTASLLGVDPQLREAALTGKKRLSS